MSRLNLQRKLSLAMGFLALLLAMSVALTIVGGAAVSRTMRQLLEVDAELSRVANQIALATLLCRSSEKDVLLHLDDEQLRTTAIRSWNEAFATLDQSLIAFERLAQQTDDRLQARQWRTQATSYHKAFSNLVAALGTDEARTLSQAKALLQPADERLRTLTITSVDVARTKAANTQQRSAALLATTEFYQGVAALLGLLGISGAVLWSALFPRFLLRPVLQLTAAAQRIAAGDLSARTPPGAGDELGVLSHSFNSMAATIGQRQDELAGQYAVAEAARAEAEEARRGIAAQLVTIEEQRETIRGLSTPVLPVAEQTLVMPLIGVLDGSRLHDMQQAALAALEQHSARHLILDITGVPVVDSDVAQGLRSVVQAARLLGAQVTIVGVRPEVAQALVGVGVDLSGIHIRRSLSAAL